MTSSTTTIPPNTLPTFDRHHLDQGDDNKINNAPAANKSRARLAVPSTSTHHQQPSHAKSIKTRSSSSKQERMNAPLGPPNNPEHFETDEEWKRFHHEEEKVSPWHSLPLVLVALPPLGAIVHGRAENWTDGMILILVCFYLYHLVRVPWDLYYASRSRRILESAPNDQDEDADTLRIRRKAMVELGRSELFSLLMTAVTPLTGAYLLYLARGMLSDPDRYINSFTISLFGLATSFKPLLHLAELFKRRSLYYQEVVHYPSTQVHLLQRKIDRMEQDLGLLNRAFATKEEVRLLRNGVDIPLTQLTKAVRRYEKKEEYLRLSSEERFALLETKLDEAQKDAMMNAELIERLKKEYDEASNPLTTLLRVLNHVLGQRSYDKSNHNSIGGSKTRQKLRWFERGPFFYLFLPVNVSSLAIGWVNKKDITAGSDFEPSPARVDFASRS